MSAFTLNYLHTVQWFCPVVLDLGYGPKINLRGREMIELGKQKKQSSAPHVYINVGYISPLVFWGLRCLNETI